MLVTKTPLGADTFGGYVNVSKQDINRSSPSILDMIINDLAEQYAIETEEEAADVIWAAAGGGPIDPDRGRRRSPVAAAVWAAAGQRVRRHQGPGPTCSPCRPTCSALIGPILSADQPDERLSRLGSPSTTSARARRVPRSPGCRSIMSAGLDAGTIVALLDRRGEGVRVQVRQPAGRRAVGVGRAGRLRRRLRRVVIEPDRHRQDHEDATEPSTYWSHPNQQVVGTATRLASSAMVRTRSQPPKAKAKDAPKAKDPDRGRRPSSTRPRPKK